MKLRQQQTKLHNARIHPDIEHELLQRLMVNLKNVRQLRLTHTKVVVGEDGKLKLCQPELVVLAREIVEIEHFVGALRNRKLLEVHRFLQHTHDNRIKGRQIDIDSPHIIQLDVVQVTIAQRRTAAIAEFYRLQLFGEEIFRIFQLSQVALELYVTILSRRSLDLVTSLVQVDHESYPIENYRVIFTVEQRKFKQIVNAEMLQYQLDDVRIVGGGEETFDGSPVGRRRDSHLRDALVRLNYNRFAHLAARTQIPNISQEVTVDFRESTQK